MDFVSATTRPGIGRSITSPSLRAHDMIMRKFPAGFGCEVATRDAPCATIRDELHRRLYARPPLSVVLRDALPRIFYLSYHMNESNSDSRHEHCLEYRGWKTRGVRNETHCSRSGAFGCMFGVSNARDLGQWEAGDPAIREWYQALMQAG